MRETASKRLANELREADLVARAAWLHFVGGLTQGEVARRLDVPNTRAHRYIARAQAEGLVRIFVDVSTSDCVAIETRLMERFGLSFCRIALDVPETGAMPLRALGMAGGDYLMQVIAGEQHRVIGIGHGRTIAAAVDAMGRVPARDVSFVSMLGGLTRSFAANPYDVIHRLARNTGADSFMLPAPMFADSARDKQVMMSQSGIAATMALIGEATLAIVGIGEVDATADTSHNLAIEDAAAIDALRKRGARAEILGQFIGADGEIVATDNDGHVMAPPLGNLRQCEVVAIAGGAGKIEAIQAALESGLLKGLITDEATARAIVGDGGRAVAAE
ncbi:MAG: sugar-binding transcriptional regulator [Pseudomonadota bacterium]